MVEYTPVFSPKKGCLVASGVGVVGHFLTL